MSRDLRDLLRELAAHAEGGHEIPQTLARRVRRTRARAAALTGLAFAVVAAGVSYGAVAVLGASSGTGPARPAGPVTSECQPGWHVAAAPASPNDQQERLSAFGAAAWNDAWAVGTRWDASGDPGGYPLIQHWDGSTWTEVGAPDQSLGSGSLFAIDVINRTDAWAVGGWITPRNAPLVMHWDGAHWTVTPVPALTNAGPHKPQTLVAIAGRSPNDVWALGNASADGFTYVHPLLHWNGKSWTVIAGPANPATAAVSLYTGIALDPSTGTPWAVGGQLQGGGENSTLSGALVQSWNGDTWVDEPTPNGSLPLDAVASADGHQIFAIRRPELQAAPIGGMSVGGVGPSSLLQWNGARWNTLLSNHGTLNSVGVVTSRDVWVVGVQHAEPLLMHWDGTSWTTVASAAPVTLREGLFAVVVANDQAVLAVGSTGAKPGSDLALWISCGTATR